LTNRQGTKKFAAVSLFPTCFTAANLVKICENDFVCGPQKFTEVRQTRAQREETR
jgi:hypothetical protein